MADKRKTPQERLDRQRSRRRVLSVVAMLSLVVLVATVAALTMPAETLEWDAQDEIHRDEPVYGASSVTSEAPAEDALADADASGAGDDADADQGVSASADALTLQFASLEAAQAAGYPDAQRVDRLICGYPVANPEGHTHSAACVETLYVADTAALETDADAEAPTYPAQVLTAELNDLAVTIEAGEGALPEGTELKLSDTDEDALRPLLRDALKADIAGLAAVDIALMQGEERVQPALPVRVTLRSAAFDAEGDPVIVHIGDDSAVERVERLPGGEASQAEEEQEEEASWQEGDEETEAAPQRRMSAMRAQRATADNAEEISFEASSFSVYAVVYTVDFAYSVDGRVYQYSLPGGGYVTLKNLIGMLGVISDSEQSIDDFVDDVTSAEFSAPELVWVGKVEEDTTVGALKDGHGLVCEYSAELTAEQIEEINAQAVEAGDWALISMHAFETEETLTVRMKNGDQFVIRVTDENEETEKTGSIQIQKIIVDTNGNMIELPDNHEVNLFFNVYRSETATSEAVKDLNVGSFTTDMASYLEGYYSVQNAAMPKDQINKTGWNEGLYIHGLPYGMYTISEVSTGIPDTLTDKNNTVWNYKNTYILTEYPWRNHNNDNYRHVSPTYTKDQAEYFAVPEVLGDHPGYSDGQMYSNDYLEFYVYNVYEAPQVELTVTKNWNGSEPSAWEATFRLQSRLKGETSYTDVRPIQTVTLKNGENSKAFASVPRYEKGADGRMIPIEYTVAEESYSMTDSTGTYTWNEIDGYSTFDEDYHYYAIVGDPTAPDGDGKSSIDVTNAPKNLGKKEHIDVKLNKTWDSSFTIGDNSSATFELKRYIRTEYRDVSQADRAASPITVNVAEGNSLSIQPGVGLYLAGTFAPHDEDKTLTFTANPSVKMKDGSSASTITVTASGKNAESAIVRSEEFFVTENTTFTLASGPEPLVSGSSIFVLDTGNATSPVKDKHFSQTITLNSGNNWQEALADLLSSETVSSDADTEIVYYYEYYLEETESTPAAYASYDTGDIDHRITANTDVTVTNGPTNRLVVEKDWRGVPDTTGFPAIKFTLYWTWADDQNGNFGGIYKDYKDIELSGNNTTWICPEELPTQMTYTDNQGNTSLKDVQYYVIEGDKNDNNSRKGSQTNGSITTSWEFYYYHNSDGAHKQTGDQGHAVAITGSKIQQSGGTITICNKLSSYRQMDIQKQFFEIGTDASIGNITSGDWSNTVLGFQVIRAIRTADGKWIDEKGNLVDKPVWMDYGDELLGGYDGSNKAVVDRGSEGFWFHDAGGNWHFRIEDNQGDRDNVNSGGSGLPCYGYYLLNGENIAVEYWYSFRETAVYSGLDRSEQTEWDWYSSITPVVAYGPPNSNLPLGSLQTADDSGHAQTVSGYAAFPYAFTDQDPMRIANFRASNLIVKKEWAKDVGASEVYFKVYRKNGNGTEDVTQLIAQDIVNNENWQGYVRDTSVIDTKNNWLILSAANDWTTTINKLLLEPYVGGGEYQYWIEEVAYKTMDGQIKYNQDAVFDPVYQKWEHASGTSGEWQGITKDDTIQLKSRGENQLKVINTASASSSYSVTKKYDGMQSSTGGQSSVSGKYPTDGTVQVVLQLQQRYRYEKTENGVDYVSKDNSEWVSADSEEAKTAWTVDWQNAESAKPSVVTLPLPKPSTATVSDEVWYNSAAAWTYNWEGLDIVKNLGQTLPDGVRVQLYYRAVEVSTPGWFDPNSTIDGTSEEGIKAVDDRTQTASEIADKSNEIKNVQGRTTLYLDKAWTGLGVGETWPSGYIVEYRLIQHYHLITAANTSTDENAAATYTPGGIIKSVNMIRANAAGATSDMVHPQATGTLEETNHNLQLTGLPMYGFFTATAEDVAEAAAAGVTLEVGKTYSVVYTYSVQETAVTKDGTEVGFKAQTVDAVADSSAEDKVVYKATLTNEVTSLSVQKKWSNYTPVPGDSVTIGLYRYTKPVATPTPTPTPVPTAEPTPTPTPTPDVSGSVKVVVNGNPSGLWMNPIQGFEKWNPDYFNGQSGETSVITGLQPGTEYHFQIAKAPSSIEGATYNNGFIYFTAVDGLTTITLNYADSSGGNEDTLTFKVDPSEWRTADGTSMISAPSSGWIKFTLRDAYHGELQQVTLSNDNDWSFSVTKGKDAVHNAFKITDISYDGVYVTGASFSQTDNISGSITFVGTAVPDGSVIIQDMSSYGTPVRKTVYANPGETLIIEFQYDAWYNTVEFKDGDKTLWKNEGGGKEKDTKFEYVVPSSGVGRITYTGQTGSVSNITVKEKNTGKAYAPKRGVLSAPAKAPVAITWTNNKDALPDGADPDSDTLVEEVTLSGSTWTKTWNDLPKYSEDGTEEYLYYVYEKDFDGVSGASSMETTYSQQPDGTWIVTNTPTIPQEAKIVVTKQVLKDDAVDTSVTGKSFTVGLFSDANGKNQIGAAQEISVTEGIGSVEFTGLEADKAYYVFEIVNDEPVITSGTKATIAEVDYKVTYESIPVNVAEARPYSVTVKNEQVMDFTVQKRWMTTSSEWNADYNGGTIYYKLYKIHTADDVVTERIQVDQGGNQITSGGVFELKFSDTVNVAEGNLGEDEAYVKENITPNADGTYSIPYMTTFVNLPVLSDGWSYTVVECDSTSTHNELRGSNGNKASDQYWTCLEFNGTTLALKNNLENVIASKTWSGMTNDKHPAVTFKLYRTEVDILETDTTDNGALAARMLTAKKLSESNPKKAEIFDSNGDLLTGYSYMGYSYDKTIDKDSTVTELTWKDLPSVNLETGKKYVYIVVEDTTGLTNYEYDGVQINDNRWSFSNKLATVEIEVEKKWKPETPPANATVTLSLSGGEINGRTVVLNGKSDWPTEHPEWKNDDWETYETSGNVENAHESGAWKALWKELPKYDDEGNLINYIVTETAKPDGYVADYTTTDNTTATSVVLTINDEGNRYTGELTNREQIDIEIKKVDSGDQTKTLSGAKFAIQKVQESIPESGAPKYEDQSTPDEKTTGTDGIVRFSNLSTGYYEIKETQMPAGYVATGSSNFYICVNGDGVKLVKVKNDKSGWEEGTDNTNVTLEGSALTFIVKNTSGATLPSTGGPGARLYTTVGLILIALAVTGLKKKTH